jgi:glycine hydroxymethyltransferase
LRIFALVGAGTKLKDFKNAVDTDPEVQSEIRNLRLEVEEFAKRFPTIGFEKSSMKYQD